MLDRIGLVLNCREALFAFSLFGFLIFLPIYADGLIPGFELFHLILFYMIPVGLVFELTFLIETNALAAYVLTCSISGILSSLLLLLVARK